MSLLQLLASFCTLALVLLPACTRRTRERSDEHPAVAQPATPQAAPTPIPAPTTPTPAAPPTAAPPAEPITLQRSIAVGRWPEGLSAHGAEAWVAESGGRTIAHVDYTAGVVLGRTRAGRLPTRVHLSGDGTVQAVSVTDQTVWTLPPAAAEFTRTARLPDAPQDAVWGDDGVLWALSWNRGSSASGAVVRVAPGDGSVTRVAEVGADAMALAVGHGKLWVAHQGGTVSVIDATTGQAQPIAVEGLHTQVAACANGVYVNDRDAVIRIDPATATVSGRQALADGARALACADDGALWVVGAHGQIARLDPASLAVTATASPPTAFEPAAARVANGSLLVTTHAYGGSDAAGALLVFNAAGR